MPLKKSVDAFHRQEDQRRHLAELRISYGNALSDCNLGRMRQTVRRAVVQPRRCKSETISKPRPAAAAKAVKRRSRPPLVEIPSQCSALQDGGPTETANSVAKRYEKLQKHARLYSNFMNSVRQAETEEKIGKERAMAKLDRLHSNLLTHMENAESLAAQKRVRSR